MRIAVNIPTRLALIDDWRWNLIHGEDAKPLNVLLYLLVKENNLIVEGFDHRQMCETTQYIAQQVSAFYGNRPMALPLEIKTIGNPRILFNQLRFDIVETSNACLPHERSAGTFAQLADEQRIPRNSVLLRNRDAFLRRLL